MRVIIPIFLLSSIALAGFEQTDISVRAKGLGGAYVGLADDVWAIFFDVGGLARVTRPEGSFLFIPEQYGVAELSVVAGAAALPTPFGVFGVAARRYGFELYRECSITFSYARVIAQMNVGINFNYHSASIRNYGSSGTLGIDMGLNMDLVNRLRWGISASNINTPTIGASHELLPQGFSSGLAFLPADDLSLSLEYKKVIGYDVSPKFGFEYWVLHGFAIRCGVSDNPAEYGAGICVKISTFRADYAVSSHQQLGLSHQASVTLRWGEAHE